MELHQQIVLIRRFTAGFTEQILVSRGQSYSVEFVCLAECTLMLVRYGDEVLEQDLHADRCVNHGDMWKVLCV